MRRRCLFMPALTIAIAASTAGHAKALDANAARDRAAPRETGVRRRRHGPRHVNITGTAERPAYAALRCAIAAAGHTAEKGQFSIDI